MALLDPSPRIVCIDVTFQFAIPISNVRLAISCGTKTVSTFHDETSQFVYAKIPLSQSEREKHWTWIQRCWAGTGKDPVLHADWSLDDYRKSPITSVRAVDGDLMRLCLWSRSRYKSVYPSDVPIPSLLKIDPAKIIEVTRRLEGMRCLEDSHPIHTAQDRDTITHWVVQPLGEYTFFYTHAKTFNRRRNIHLGNLLGQIREEESLTPRVKLVLCRLAAIINAGDLVSFSMKGKALIEDEDPSFFEKIKLECTGVGLQQVENGSLWLELGLWTKLQDQGTISGTGSQHTIVLAEGFVTVNLQSAKRMSAYVEMLQNHFNLSTFSTEDNDTKLTGAEIDQVNRALMWAYLHRMVFVPSVPRNEGALDMVSMRPVTMQRAPVFAGRILALIPDGELGGFLGIYQGYVLRDHGSRMQTQGFTLIPNHLLQEVVDHFGRPLSHTVCTTLPVPTGR